MTCAPKPGKFTTLFTKNGHSRPHNPAVLVGEEEPEATRRQPKQADAPLPPTARGKAARKRYSAEEKRRILRLAEACTKRGELGALLRREGIYYTTLRLFQAQREQGRLDGPEKSTRKDKAEQVLKKQLEQLQRENRRLKDNLEKAEIVIDFQKKLSRLLQSPPNETD